MKRLLTLLFAGLLASSASAQLRLAEEWSDVFAGTHHVFHAVTPGGPASWSFSVGGAVVARGDLAANGEIALDMPATKPGVILDASLVLEAGGKTVSHRLWIFPADPWSETKATLEKAVLRVFDPEGNTIAALHQAGIPYKIVPRATALSEAGGPILIGEGLSLNEQRGLPAILEQAAVAGAHILCLAPREGYLALPGLEGERRPTVSLAGTGRIPALDKHLDAAVWPDGPSVATSWTPDAARRRMEGEWHADTKGWPWLEARWPNGGRLIYCGVGIMRSWEKTPAARYLLEAMLRDVVPPLETPR